QCAPELGIYGMGARWGHRRPEHLLVDLGKMTYTAAAQLVNNGEALGVKQQLDDLKIQGITPAPDMAGSEAISVIAQALDAGELSPAQAGQLKAGLDKARDALSAEEQLELAVDLVNTGADLGVQ